MRRSIFVGLVSAMTGLSGCNNACQEICGRMANYAQDCNIDVPDSEIDACIEDQAAATSDDLKACRQDGSAEDIRTSWTCETLADFWAGGGSIPPPPE